MHACLLACSHPLYDQHISDASTAETDMKHMSLVGRRLSDIRDCKKQSVPAGGVAPLLNALPHLKDLTLYMHKPPEVR